MADEVTPTNGRANWTRHLPLGLALVAAVGAGVAEARIESVQESVRAQAALDARVRENTEAIAGLKADDRAWREGHDKQLVSNVEANEKEKAALERRIELLERRR